MTFMDYGPDWPPATPPAETHSNQDQGRGFMFGFRISLIVTLVVMVVAVVVSDRGHRDPTVPFPMSGGRPEFTTSLSPRPDVSRLPHSGHRSHR